MNISQLCYNPLNIRYSVYNEWKGQDGSYKGFVRFKSDVYGYRAAIKLLIRYMEMGTTMVKYIIYRWAPESENNTEEYLNFIERKSDLRLRRETEIETWHQLFEMVQLMTIMERGYKANDNDIQEAILMLLKESDKERYIKRLGYYVSQDFNKNPLTNYKSNYGSNC